MLGKHKPQDLLNQSDASTLRPAEDAEWLALSDQGRQLWAQIDQTMLRIKSGEEKIFLSAVLREQLGIDDQKDAASLGGLIPPPK